MKHLLHGGKIVLAKLQKHFDDKVAIFSAPGLSSHLIFCDTVPSEFRLIDDNDDDVMIKNISKQFTESVEILCLIKTSAPSR